MTTYHIDPSNVKHLVIVIINARLLIRIYKEMRDLLNIEQDSWDAKNAETAYWQNNPQLNERQLNSEENAIRREMMTVHNINNKRTAPTDERPKLNK